MPLTSNRKETFGHFLRLNPDMTVNDERDLVSRYVDFTVSPSPCLNSGNMKDPVPYSFTKVEEQFPYGRRSEWFKYIDRSVDWRGVWTTAFYRSTGVDPSSSFWYGYTLNPVQDAAYNRCLAKLYDAMKASEVSLNTSIGEGRETLHMLSSVRGSALRVLRDLRSPRRLLRKMQALGSESTTNPLQLAGSVWLGWSVGWKPLLSDVEAISNHALSGKLESVPFEVKARATQENSDAINNGVSNYAYPGALGRYETLLTSVRHQMALRYKITDLNQFEVWRAGLTVRPTLAWELLTLSFVIDYFINVGQLLELLEASLLNNGIEFVSGYHTRTTKEYRTFALEWTTDRPVGLDIAPFDASFKAFKTTSTKDRSLLGSFPTPVLPVVKIPSAAQPLLVIAALLTNLLPRKI